MVSVSVKGHGGKGEQMTREEFKYAIKSCGCFMCLGQTYYEESELIKAFEDMGLIEQEPCKDCISRQAALELFTWTNTKEDIWYGLKLLPSVAIPSAEPFKEMTNGEVLEEVFGSNFYPPLVFCADWYKEPYKGEQERSEQNG